MELTEQQKAFMEFLLDPDSSKPSQRDWCAENGVSVRTAISWKKNKLFRDEWEKRAYEIHGGPERISKIVDKLYDRAIEGDVKAMQLYLQYVDKFTPKKEIVTESKALAEMSDEELADLGENIINLRKAK